MTYSTLFKEIEGPSTFYKQTIILSNHFLFFLMFSVTHSLNPLSSGSRTLIQWLLNPHPLWHAFVYHSLLVKKKQEASPNRIRKLSFNMPCLMEPQVTHIYGQKHNIPPYQVRAFHHVTLCSQEIPINLQSLHKWIEIP